MIESFTGVIKGVVSNFYPSNQNTKIDAITLLASFALMPCYNEGTRIGTIHHHKVDIQEPKVIMEYPVTVDLQPIIRKWYGNSREEAIIFKKTIEAGIKENGNRKNFHRLCSLAKDGLIQYIRNYEDSDDNALDVFKECIKILVDYCKTPIKKEESFNKDSTQRWDDWELKSLITYIDIAKEEDKQKQIKPAREVARVFLDLMHDSKIHKMLIDEFAAQLKV